MNCPVKGCGAPLKVAKYKKFIICEAKRGKHVFGLRIVGSGNGFQIVLKCVVPAQFAGGTFALKL